MWVDRPGDADVDLDRIRDLGIGMLKRRWRARGNNEGDREDLLPLEVCLAHEALDQVQKLDALRPLPTLMANNAQLRPLNVHRLLG